MSESEREELARLRAEATARRGGHRGWRWTGAVVLMVVASLIFTVSVVAVFVRTQLLDTDRYVATIAPLARDPVVQDAITARVTQEVMSKLDVAGLTQQLLTALQQRGAPPVLNNLVGPITSGVQSFISTQVHNVVTSGTFAQIWDNANRTAHSELAALLTTGQGKLLSAQGTQVSLNVGAIVDEVKQRLVAQGFNLASKIPQSSATVPLFTANKLPRIQTAVSWLNTLAWLLPLVALVLAIAGIWVAPNRRRGLLTVAIMLAVAMFILLGLLSIVRTYVLNHLPNTVQSPDAVRVIYDTELRFLVQALKTLAVLFIIVAFVAWAFGTSALARLLRRGVNAGLDAGGRGMSVVPLGPVPEFLRHQRKAIIVALIMIAAAILVIWRTPGISGVIWLTVGVLVLSAIVEILARTTPRPPSAAAPAPST